MTCPNCQQAGTTAHWPIFQADCHGCKVRSLATGPAYHTAMKSNAMTPGYRSALQDLFGVDWLKAHDEVKAEYERMKALIGKRKKL